MTIYERILAEVARRPHLTEQDITQALFGQDGDQQRVNSDCRWLVSQGKLKRNGVGNSSDPCTYTIPYSNPSSSPIAAKSLAGSSAPRGHLHCSPERGGGPRRILHAAGWRGRSQRVSVRVWRPAPPSLRATSPFRGGVCEYAAG